MTQTPIDATDIPRGDWIDRFVPAPARPYFRLARLDRPIGTWLLLLPCWWGVTLASPDLPDWRLIALFGIGAVVMRAAGCVINDLADRKFDREVARTATRPLASGAVSPRAAFAFLGLLLLGGLAVLLQLRLQAIVLGFCAVPLFVVYPFMKRITYWPQAWLGLTFNWGALVGWAAVRGEIAMPAVLLYVAGFFWTLGYDTIYGHQDKEDDRRVGLKSLPLYLGERTRPFLLAFYVTTFNLLMVAGYAGGMETPYFISLFVAGAHLAWQVATVRIDEPRNCLARFRSNRDFGLLVWVGMLLSHALW